MLTRKFVVRKNIFNILFRFSTPFFLFLSCFLERVLYAKTISSCFFCFMSRFFVFLHGNLNDRQSVLIGCHAVVVR
jgi:hypothetical protein